MLDQVIQILHNLALDPGFERAHQKIQFRVEFEAILGHPQSAIDAGSGETHLIHRFTFFVSAAHAKFFFGMFGPLKGNFSRLTQAQRVMAQDMKISHLSASLVFVSRPASVQRQAFAPAV